MVTFGISCSLSWSSWARDTFPGPAAVVIRSRLAGSGGFVLVGAAREAQHGREGMELEEGWETRTGGQSHRRRRNHGDRPDMTPTVRA